jgi:hypothetical protein
VPDTLQRQLGGLTRPCCDVEYSISLLDLGCIQQRWHKEPRPASDVEIVCGAINTLPDRSV